MVTYKTSFVEEQNGLSDQNRLDQLALAFDDVLLTPGPADMLLAEVDMADWLSAELPMRIPIMPAATDSVTEISMAIGLARLGGLGIIDRIPGSQPVANFMTSQG